MASSVSTTAGPSAAGGYSGVANSEIGGTGNRNPAETLQGLKSLFQFIDFDYTQFSSYSQHIRNRMGEGNQEAALEVIARALCWQCSKIAVLFGKMYAKYGENSYLLWGCVQMLRDHLKIGRPQDSQLPGRGGGEALKDRILNQCELKLQSKGLLESLLRDLITWETGLIEIGGVITHRLFANDQGGGGGYHPGNSSVEVMKKIVETGGGGARSGEPAALVAQEDDSTAEEQFQTDQKGRPRSGFGVVKNGDGTREERVVEATVVLKQVDQQLSDHGEKIREDATGNRRKMCSYCPAVFNRIADKNYHMRCKHSTLFFDMPPGTLETDVDAAVGKIRKEGWIHPSARHQRRFYCQLCRETTEERTMKFHVLQCHLQEVISRLKGFPIPGPSGATLRPKSRPNRSCNTAK